MSWIDELNVGDKVIESTGYVTSVESVTKITKTTICVGNRRYAKNDGNLRCRGKYDKHCIMQWTQEWQDKRDYGRKKSLLAKQFTSGTPWVLYPLSMLEQVQSLIMATKREG